MQFNIGLNNFNFAPGNYTIRAVACAQSQTASSFSSECMYERSDYASTHDLQFTYIDSSSNVEFTLTHKDGSTKSYSPNEFSIGTPIVDIYAINCSNLFVNNEQWESNTYILTSNCDMIATEDALYITTEDKQQLLPPRISISNNTLSITTDENEQNVPEQVVIYDGKQEYTFNILTVKDWNEVAPDQYYLYTEAQTWGAWISSSCNTAGWVVHGDTVRDSNNRTVTEDGVDPVKLSDNISYEPYYLNYL